MPRIAFYISSHGFGHATREIEVINHLPISIEVEVITAVPQWLFDHSIHRPYEYVHLSHDIGLIQIDSTTADYKQTLERWQQLLREYPALAQQEAERLCENNTNVVVGDISPLAVAAAKASGLPIVMIGNFSWDWIFQPLLQHEAGFQEVIETISSYYRECGLLLRTPLSGDLSVFPRIEDIPLIVRTAKRSREEVRIQYKIPEERTVILLTFGGNQYPLPTQGFEEHKNITFITFDESFKHIPNAVHVNPKAIYHPDIVNMCNGVISKLGYGIVTECIAHSIPLAYPPRYDFPEHEIMEYETAQYIPITQFNEAELKEGNWGFIERFQKTFGKKYERQKNPDTNGGAKGAYRLISLLTPTA